MSGVLVTGGLGYVGGFITQGLGAAGYSITATGRTPPPSDDYRADGVRFASLVLNPETDYRSVCEGPDTLIHAAFSHVPGRYRGGEGDDPDGFRRANIDGSLKLIDDAIVSGVHRIVFLSSRAVYGAYAPGTPLQEDMPARPDTLYGEAKLAIERVLSERASPTLQTTSLRITGVYGPSTSGHADKWHSLFTDFMAGRPISPRPATEVHGEDVSGAVRTLLTTHQPWAPLYNVSDIVVDRADILAGLAAQTGKQNVARGDSKTVSAMTTDRLRALGWQPGGMAHFTETINALTKSYLSEGSSAGEG